MKHDRRLLFSVQSSESVSLLAVLAVVIIVTLALIGWLLDIPVLKGISPQWAAMRAITIACFFMSAAAMVILQQGAAIRGATIIARIFAAAIIMVGLLTLTSYLVELRTGQEWSWAMSPLLSPFLASTARMAVITAILFSIYGCVLLLFEIGGRRAADIAHVVVLPIALMTYLVLVGYLFNVRVFYEWLHLGVALNTGIAFCALCIASLFARPDTWLMSAFTGDKAGAIMARRLLPAFLILPLLIGWLRLHGERFGIFSSEFGVALVAVVYTVCFLSLVWLNAKFVNRSDQHRRDIESSLRESEQRLKHALEAGDLGIWGLDTKTGQAWRSLRHDQIFGYETLLSEWTYQMFLDHVLPEDREEVDQKFGHALLAGTEWNFECRIQRSDGVYRWIWAQGKPRINDRNEVVQLVGLVRDITDSKHMEEELRKAHDRLELRVRERTAELSAVNEELLDQIEERKRAEQALQMANAYNRSLLEASLDPLITIDADGRITDVNAAMETITGYLREELIGTDFSSYFTEPERARAGYRRVFRESAVHDYALEIKHQDGHLTPVLYNAALYRDKTGAVAGIFAAARDITARRLAEKELEKYRQHLEELVENRTAELTAANKELESFSYSVSHDLRAPLRHMSGFVELLKKRIKPLSDEKMSHYAEIISAASGKMGMLIDDLRAFSRIGRSDIRMNVVDVNRLVREAVEELGDECRGRDIHWKIGNLPDVYGDPSMLSLMLVNLIANAIKYTRSRPHAIIEIACLNDENGEITFFIRDNGVGFDMKFQDKLFGVFQRLHHEDEFEGTGIGLANVRRIISRHGGRTWAEGALDQGATFYFTLPAIEETKACRN